MAKKEKEKNGFVKQLFITIVGLGFIGSIILSADTPPTETVDSTINNAEYGDTTNTDTAEATPEPEPPAIQDIVLNVPITTEYTEYTFTNVELSYKVIPSDTSSMFYSTYTPDVGNVYIDVSVEVKNLAKSSVGCDKVLSMKADYNDGYTYSGFTAVEDKNTGFTYSNISNIDPLETKKLRFLIQCPAEVEETDNSLFLTTTLDNQNYKYTIR